MVLSVGALRFQQQVFLDQGNAKIGATLTVRTMSSTNSPTVLLSVGSRIVPADLCQLWPSLPRRFIVRTCSSRPVLLFSLFAIKRWSLAQIVARLALLVAHVRSASRQPVLRSSGESERSCVGPTVVNKT